MTQRKAVRLPIDQLVEIHERREPAFFVDWSCRLCPHRTAAVDRTTALNAAADHMHTAHRAHGGHHVRRHR